MTEREFRRRRKSEPCFNGILVPGIAFGHGVPCPYWTASSPLIVMPENLAALRLQVETALAGRVAAPFSYRDRKLVEMVSAGIPEIDALTGGLPRGGLTEICGPSSSGRTSLLVSALASRTAQAEVCALVDGRDAFDPYAAAAAGGGLEKLLGGGRGNGVRDGGEAVGGGAVGVDGSVVIFETEAMGKAGDLLETEKKRKCNF